MPLPTAFPSRRDLVWRLRRFRGESPPRKPSLLGWRRPTRSGCLGRQRWNESAGRDCMADASQIAPVSHETACYANERPMLALCPDTGNSLQRGDSPPCRCDGPAEARESVWSLGTERVQKTKSVLKCPPPLPTLYTSCTPVLAELKPVNALPAQVKARPEQCPAKSHTCARPCVLNSITLFQVASKIRISGHLPTHAVNESRQDVRRFRRGPAIVVVQLAQLRQWMLGRRGVSDSARLLRAVIR